MKSEYERAMDRALYSLGRGDKSEASMRDYLIKKEFSEGAVDEVIEKLKDYGYIDDAKLAISLVRGVAQAQRGGKRKAAQKLWQKGIKGEAAQAALEAIDSEGELERALYWAQKLLPTLSGEDAKRKEKLYRRLLSKGFSYDVAGAAVRAALIGESSDDGFEG